MQQILATVATKKKRAGNAPAESTTQPPTTSTTKEPPVTKDVDVPKSKGKKTAPVSALTPKEEKDFARHERVIDDGLAKIDKTCFEVGKALFAVRDGRLYRAAFGTFDEYLAAKVQLTRQRAAQLIDAAAVKENLSTEVYTTLPETERQVRPLARLRGKPDQQRQAWERALELAGDGPVAPLHVSNAVDEIKPPQKKETVKPAVAVAAGTDPSGIQTIMAKLLDAGFDQPFEQPFPWLGNGMELIWPDRKAFVKFIDALGISEVALVMAARAAKVEVTVIIAATANQRDGAVLAKEGEDLADSFSPQFNVVATELNALIAFGGRLHRSSGLDAQFRTAWAVVDPFAKATSASSTTETGTGSPTATPSTTAHAQ